MAAHTRRLLASDPAATEWLNFTYVVGGAGDTPIQAIKLTGSRLLPRPPHDSVGPAEDTVIVTVYYPQGAARGRPSSSGLNFAYGGCPRALSYNPDTDLVHNDHPLHTATLHKADGAYDWHCHILLPPKRLWPFLELLLNRHCRDVSAAQRHLGQLRSTQVAPIAPSADEPSDSSGITGPLTYPDGSAVIFGACRDGEAFSRLSALERQWGPVGSRVSGSTEVQMIKEALEWLTVYNAVELLDKLAKRFTAPRLRELRFWKGNAIEHILVEAGATEGLAHGLRKHGLNANVVREADSCTPLHLACYPKKTAEAEAWFASRRPRLVAVLLGAGADPTLTNKWRESTSDNAVVKAALREQIRDGGAQPVSAPGPGSLRPAPPPLHSFRRQPTAPPSEASLRGGTLLAVPPLLASVAESSDRKRRGGDISGSPPRKSLRDEMKDTVHRAPRYVTAESSGDAPRVAVKPGEKTYVANVGYLSKPELARALGDRWREVTPGEGKDLGRVDLVVIDGAFWYDKSTQGLACGAKSRIYTSKTLLMKYEIHALLMASKSSYIPECILYDASHRPPRLPDGVWIWRPTVPHGGGHGVAIVTNQRQFEAEVRKMRQLRAKQGVLTRYIESPLLYTYGGRGYKCHLRMYYLVVVVADRPDQGRAALYKHGEIDLAMLPYVNRDYVNPDIHDTRRAGVIQARGSGQVIRFPEEFPGGPAAAAPVFDQMKRCLHDIAAGTLTRVQPYPGCDLGYNLFGADFLVDSSGQLYVLEINAAPGFPDADRSVNEELSSKIFGGMKEFVLDHTASDRLKHVVQVYPR